MGTVEIFNTHLLIRSHIITYGHAADEGVTQQIVEEISTMWNAPQASIWIRNDSYPVRFHITGQYMPQTEEMDILTNDNPENNYFRIATFAEGNISFVDGIGSNTGYFLLENLYQGSTTAAHEYGHTIGLEHPADMDYRGQGVPGIMFPRGTLVDPPFQYDPTAAAGGKGGTMHPMHRKVKQEDIDDLRIPRLIFENNKAVIGEFTSVWHYDHNEFQ